MQITPQKRRGDREDEFVVSSKKQKTKTPRGAGEKRKGTGGEQDRPVGKRPASKQKQPESEPSSSRSPIDVDAGYFLEYKDGVRTRREFEISPSRVVDIGEWEDLYNQRSLDPVLVGMIKEAMWLAFENKEQSYELPILKLTPLGLQKPTPGTWARRLKPEEWKDELAGRYYYYAVCGQHNAAAARSLLGSEVAKRYNFDQWPARMLYFSYKDFDGYFLVISQDNKKDHKAPPRQLKLSAVFRKFESWGLDDDLWDGGRKYVSDSALLKDCPLYLGCEDDHSIEATEKLAGHKKLTVGWRNKVLSVLIGNRLKSREVALAEGIVHIKWKDTGDVTSIALFSNDPLEADIRGAELKEAVAATKSHTFVLDLCEPVDLTLWKPQAWETLNSYLQTLCPLHSTLVVFVPQQQNLSFVASMHHLSFMKLLEGKWVRRTQQKKSFPVGSNLYTEEDRMYILFKGDDLRVNTSVVYEGRLPKGAAAVSLYFVESEQELKLASYASLISIHDEEATGVEFDANAKEEESDTESLDLQYDPTAAEHARGSSLVGPSSSAAAAAPLVSPTARPSPGITPMKLLERLRAMAIPPHAMPIQKGEWVMAVAVPDGGWVSIPRESKSTFLHLARISVLQKVRAENDMFAPDDPSLVSTAGRVFDELQDKFWFELTGDYYDLDTSPSKGVVNWKVPPPGGPHGGPGGGGPGSRGDGGGGRWGGEGYPPVGEGGHYGSTTALGSSGGAAGFAFGQDQSAGPSQEHATQSTDRPASSVGSARETLAALVTLGRRSSGTSKSVGVRTTSVEKPRVRSIVNLRDDVLEIFDSFPRVLSDLRFYISVFELIVEYLERQTSYMRSGRNWKSMPGNVVVDGVPRQVDGASCGVFMWMFATLLQRGDQPPFWFSSQDILLIRRQLASCILECRCLL
ncbi:hypothetical protein CBR_g54159 [Chara braunii]|uniref:Ubiquitin-like protease family profile domain-containing protein n=1 Tax=Chara braunii TaxID=69332 RepID=A0A388MC54_CHABU|nr:hypothetical protein CBR_g54159 [Chara braunii]|eukprot:GBG92039.1 hypothetical protein CBR_g54159 [Chara braunii]